MKLKSKKLIHYDNPVDVYDITIDKYNNFSVYLNNSLVVVHNCTPTNADKFLKFA